MSHIRLEYNHYEIWFFILREWFLGDSFSRIQPRMTDKSRNGLRNL